MAQHESLQPPQHQTEQPGRQGPMSPQPSETRPTYRGSGKLLDKIALITGGDSGIGRAVAILYAREGAKIGIIHLQEDEDAEETRRLVGEEGQPCLVFRGDVGQEETCRKAVACMVEAYGRIDILINNAAEQHPQDTILDITAEQLERTFRTNIFSQFHMVKAALPHMSRGACIVNTTSVTAYKGSPRLLDYSATKGAIVAFTRSLSMAFSEQGIRVNAVAPGPIWTPLIPSTFTEEQVAEFGANVPMKRAGQPDEVAPAFVFLASADSSYLSGQVIHPNGGTIVNG